MLSLRARFIWKKLIVLKVKKTSVGSKPGCFLKLFFESVWRRSTPGFKKQGAGAHVA